MNTNIDNTKNDNTKKEKHQKHKKNKLVDTSDDESLSSHDTKSNQTKTESDTEFVKECEILLDKITKSYKEQRNEIRHLIKLHKKEMKLAKKTKKHIGRREKTGFTKPSPIPDKLAEFIHVERGTEMSRTDLTKRIYYELHHRNLYYKNDKRVLRADNDIKKIFNLPENVNQSTNPNDKNGFNFYNLQTYIAKCYNENLDKSKKILSRKLEAHKNTTVII
jgi:chromatin remodeling complex protein RSC6